MQLKCSRISVNKIKTFNKKIREWESCWNMDSIVIFASFRSIHPQAFLQKGFLKISKKFTIEHSCRSVIVIEIILWHGCSLWICSLCSLQICFIFSEDLFLESPLDGCFWSLLNTYKGPPELQCIPHYRWNFGIICGTQKSLKHA